MLSKKAKYAIKALLALAQDDTGEPMRIADLAEQESLPPKFLELILLELRHAGVVQSRTVLRHARRFGPNVRLELDRLDDGQVIEAEVPRARFEELGIGLGERVYVKPRSARLFPR
jgi:hypothetical protein